tara:strand:- start:182 stop:532 length:351 start_codon:yes stop_codon:yes gene_type:complete
MKQVDKLKSLQDKLVAMETKEVREYLEVKKTIDALRSSIKKEMVDQVIIKPNGIGIPRTFKSWSEVNMVDATVSPDRKAVRGFLKGDKEMALVYLSHRKAYQVKANTMLSIKGWVD